MDSQFTKLLKSYIKKTKNSNKTNLALRIGVTPRILRKWLNQGTPPERESTCKLIRFFLEMSIMNMEQAEEFYEAAAQASNYKTYDQYPIFDLALIGYTSTIHKADKVTKISLIKIPVISSTNLSITEETKILGTSFEALEELSAEFTIKNISNEPILIKEIGFCCRLGSTWNDPEFDFPHDKGIRLKPKGEHRYFQSRNFENKGRYFGEVCVDSDSHGKWLGVPKDSCLINTSADTEYPRIYFHVS